MGVRTKLRLSSDLHEPRTSFQSSMKSTADVQIIQRGRSKDTELDLFKTHQKGWGVKARYDIPKGTFLGIYSGELVPDYESERRSYLYDQIGRTWVGCLASVRQYS